MCCVLTQKNCKWKSVAIVLFHNIQSKNGIFILENHQQQTFIADKVILATGGKAWPQLGSAGNGYTLAKQLGHTVTPLYPALTILKTPPEYVKSLKGMRSHVTATLKCNGKAIRHEKGEVQFTEQGTIRNMYVSIFPSRCS